MNNVNSREKNINKIKYNNNIYIFFFFRYNKKIFYDNTMAAKKRVEDVGIIDIETYFPKLYVSQEDLEESMNVSKGKFTKGLLQKNMAVADCSEDIVSMCLTAMHNLMERGEIDWKDIGRISVGSESSIDKSKSIKSYMMDIFVENENTNILGVDCINACYGGTSAFLDSVNWIESSRWNGKYALVLTGDIATYEEGAARPTGGAGVSAMLIGPDAPIVLGRNLSSHFENVYDFYKPNMISEYPVVDGKLSNECYSRALDKCYHYFNCEDGRDILLFDYSIFHAPYGKLVKKCYERLLDKEENEEESRKRAMEKNKLNVFDKKIREELYEKRVLPTMKLSNECGNMYTGSIFSALYSLLTSKESIWGKNVLIFSYGSGLASTMFELEFSKDKSKFKKWKEIDLDGKLNDRIKISPKEFSEKLDKRENKIMLNNENLSNHKPIVFDNTFVLKSYDNLHRRSYERININCNNKINNITRKNPLGACAPMPTSLAYLTIKKRNYSSRSNNLILKCLRILKK